VLQKKIAYYVRALKSGEQNVTNDVFAYVVNNTDYCKKRKVLPKPCGPTGWRWSPFP